MFDAYETRFLVRKFSAFEIHLSLLPHVYFQCYLKVSFLRPNDIHAFNSHVVDFNDPERSTSVS